MWAVGTSISVVWCTADGLVRVAGKMMFTGLKKKVAPHLRKSTNVQQNNFNVNTIFFFFFLFCLLGLPHTCMMPNS